MLYIRDTVKCSRRSEFEISKLEKFGLKSNYQMQNLSYYTHFMDRQALEMYGWTCLRKSFP